MDNNTLSICMITKNEENNLDRCLKSITHIADEIIVVDTGSDDKTVDIAKKYGANVILHPWKNDFSDARNKSIEHATQKWILFLDADEELSYEDGLALKEILSNKENHYEGFYLKLTNIIDKVDVGDSIVFRVFKNNPDYRFKGKMHEQIINSIQDKCGPESIASTQVKILHYGYDPNLADIDQKSKRNIELLLSYEEKDKDGYYYYALGNEYVRIQNIDEAFKCFDIAYKKALETPARPIYFTYLMTSIFKTYFSCKRYDKISECSKIFKRDCRDFKDLYFYECLANMECGKFSDAKKCLKSYLNTTSTNYSYPTSNFEKQYNLDEMMTNLNKSSIHHDEKLLDIVMFVKEHDESLINTIKTFNEISNKVIIVTPKSSNLNKEELQGYKADVYDVDFDDDNECYAYAFRKSRSKYVIVAETGELCSFEGQQVIIDFLEKANKDGYFVLLADQYNKVLGKSLRLFKNNKKLSKFETFQKFITENRVDDSVIPLYKYS